MRIDLVFLDELLKDLGNIYRTLLLLMLSQSIDYFERVFQNFAVMLVIFLQNLRNESLWQECFHVVEHWSPGNFEDEFDLRVVSLQELEGVIDVSWKEFIVWEDCFKNFRDIFRILDQGVNLEIDVHFCHIFQVNLLGWFNRSRRAR